MAQLVVRRSSFHTALPQVNLKLAKKERAEYTQSRQKALTKSSGQTNSQSKRQILPATDLILHSGIYKGKPCLKGRCAELIMQTVGERSQKSTQKVG